VLTAIVVIALIMSAAIKARAAEACGLAMLPLAVNWLFSTRLHQDFAAPITLLSEVATLLLLLRAAVRFDRRFPLAMAAFILISVVAGVMGLAHAGLQPWQFRIITISSWVGADASLLAGFIRFFPQLRDARRHNRLQ
jgi:hypothetical protein